jgi:Zn-dependent protease
MKFSQIEITDLLKSWIAISIAFGIIIARNMNIPLTSQNFIIPLLISALTVGIGFLFHELGHKYMAQKYNYWAEFRASNSMLIFALILAYFTSFIFAAPGAVMIQGYYITKEKNGKISAAGPIINLILGTIFILLLLLGIKNMFTTYGALINAWIALFNMIPLANFDGKKILAWDKKVYFSMLAFGFLLLFFSGLIGGV